MDRSTAAVRLLAGDKEPVRLATTANITLAGLSEIDGVTPEAGDRVLVKDQIDATGNGIYTASVGEWRRAPDSSASRLLIAGMKIAIQEGDTHGGEVWNLDTGRPNIGTDAIQFSFYLGSDIVGQIQDAAAEGITNIANAASDILATAWAATNAADFASRAAAILFNIPTGLSYVRTAGYAAAGDGGHGLYKKVVSEPSHAGKFQSDDGAWWELVETRPRFEQFGAFGSPIGTATASLTDELSALQAACDYAATHSRIVEVTPRYFGISGLLKPGADVVLNAFNNGGAIVNKTTSSGIRVNHRTKLLGNLTGLGTGTTSVVERLIYPDVASCADVELDVTLGNATFGVQAEYIDGNPANSPRRWKGIVRSHPTLPIVGTQGESEGYLFLGTLRDSSYRIFGKDTARHDYYLAAGAQDNYAEVHSEGCLNFATQINTYTGQPESSGNQIDIYAKSLGRGVVGSSGACAIVGNSSRNIVNVSQMSGGTDYCVLVQGADDASTTPRGNQINCRDVNGTFLGTDVIKLENEDTTQVKGSIAAKATASVIGIRRAGTTGALHGAMIDNISIDTFGGNIPCVLDNITDIPTYIGPGKYRNSATSPTAAPIQDNSSGKRYGYAVEYSGLFSATGAAGGTSGGVTGFNVTMPGKLDPTYRKPAVSLTVGFGSVTSAVPLSAIAGTIVKTDAVLPIRVFNGHTASQDVPVFWRVAGDPALP